MRRVTITWDKHTLTNVCLQMLLCALKGGFKMRQPHVEWHVAFSFRIHLQVQEDYKTNIPSPLVYNTWFIIHIMSSHRMTQTPRHLKGPISNQPYEKWVGQPSGQKAKQCSRKFSMGENSYLWPCKLRFMSHPNCYESFSCTTLLVLDWVYK